MTRKEAAKLLEMEINKKVFQQHFTSSTGKVVTLKDITNVQSEIHQSSESNNLDTLVQYLKGMEGISSLQKKFVYSSLFIQVLQLNFTLMTRMNLQDFFQDCIMKATFFFIP